ncbi:helix-turn-helix domain-containing protein [Kiloniella sp. EL199]|uniref:helix-turn-helix domain-containing protein n=1 Tax=Kiloniella sp. EL199 TaxID=2107581 RepID=UPI000EA4051C|nr:XRE family transcriptional regulator [Kiloniella sp. EL199]
MARPKVENELEEESVTVGGQIRDLRKAKRMSVTTLAEKIGKSVGYVSQIERGISAVSIPILNKISAALEISNSWFFHGENDADPTEKAHVVRAGSRRRLSFTGSGMVEELMSPDLSGDVELIMGRFEPGSATGEEQITREKVEVSGHVIKGTIAVEIGEDTYELGVGDSFRINPGDPHKTYNNGAEEAEVLWILSPPHY